MVDNDCMQSLASTDIGILDKGLHKNSPRLLIVIDRKNMSLSKNVANFTGSFISRDDWKSKVGCFSLASQVVDFKLL